MEAFLGTILPWPMNWAPQGWVLCQGQSIPVAQNQALYSLISNTYGGNSTNFNVPDLRGRFPIGYGANPITGGIYNMGDHADNKQVTLIANNIPAHTHTISNNVTGGSAAVNFDLKIPVNTDAYNATTAASVPGNTCTFGAAKTSGGQTANIYTTNAPTAGQNLKPINVQTTAPVSSITVTSTCSTVAPNPLTPISIMPPYVCLNYIMCVEGLYPMRP